MDELLTRVGEWLTGPSAMRTLRVALIVLFGLVISRQLARGAAALVERHRGANAGMVTRRLATYGLYTVVLLTALKQLGFELSVLLGAAGVLTVAVGFAAQTSASNLISGLFLMGERPFGALDVIEVDGVLGEVISIDLLSVKLRTFDNLLVRIPNETMVKARLTNYSHHPIRRIELPFSVAYDTDLPKVEALLRELAFAHPHIFEEPAPMVVFQAFGASSIDGFFRVWTTRAMVIELRSELLVKVKQAFDANGIEIPFPQRVIHHRPGGGGGGGGVPSADLSPPGA